MIENFVEYDFHEEKSGAVLVIVNQFFERLLFLLNILIFYLYEKNQKEL